MRVALSKLAAIRSHVELVWNKYTLCVSATKHQTLVTLMLNGGASQTTETTKHQQNTHKKRENLHTKCSACRIQHNRLYTGLSGYHVQRVPRFLLSCWIHELFARFSSSKISLTFFTIPHFVRSSLTLSSCRLNVTKEALTETISTRANLQKIKQKNLPSVTD